MKSRTFFLQSIFLCLSIIRVYGQIKVDSVACSYFNGISRRYEIVDLYQITNTSDEEYLTWISLHPNEAKPTEALIREFFLKPKGDFNLMGLFNEDFYIPTCEIGYTFIKSIKPRETFSYVVKKTRVKSTFYRDRIVVISRKEVEQFLKFHIADNFLYKEPIIVLCE